jgi:L-aspartate oxidase
VDNWWRYVLPRQFETAAGWELQNLLTIARTVIEAALLRQESRGVHLRVDFPHTDPQWCRHIAVVRGADGGVAVRPTPERKM